MSVKLQKINNVTVEKVPQLHKRDKRPIKGEDLFSEIYGNIFLCARKQSGKTSTIYKILKECCGKDTKVIAFVSTLYKDSNWETIREYCKIKKLEFEGHTSLKEDGVDQLELLVESLQEEAKEQENEIDDDEKVSVVQFGNDEFEVEVKKKKRKEKYRAPEYIIILDDLSSELKSKSLVALLKKNRHFKAKILVSSQYLNDLLPEARKQMDYFLVFKGQPENKLKEIHKDADVNVDFEDFIELYRIATEPKYSFLYIDTAKNEYRRNFNTLLDLTI